MCTSTNAVSSGINRAIMERMAEDDHPGVKSPELDLDRLRGQSLASNIVFPLAWFTLEQYEDDALIARSA